MYGCVSISCLQLWFGLSRWHASEAGGGAAAAAGVLNKARKALPECSILHFAAAELEEARGDLDAARNMYEEQVMVRFLFLASVRYAPCSGIGGTLQEFISLCLPEKHWVIQVTG